MGIASLFYLFIAIGAPAGFTLSSDCDLPGVLEQNSQRSQYCQRLARGEAKDEFVPALSDKELANMKVRVAISGKWKKLWQKTKYLGAVGAAAIAVMTQLPQEITAWSDEVRDPDNYLRNWESHVTSAPQEKDFDSVAVNYVLHPYWGGQYHVLCRQTDPSFTFGECFLFSFLISTFLWEYGVEAFMEKPSLTDLVFTPLGALMGEAFYQLIQAIKANEGKVWGSKLLGNVLIGAMSSLDTIVTGLQNTIEEVFGEYDISTSFFYGNNPRENEHFIPSNDREMMIQFRLRF